MEHEKTRATYITGLQVVGSTAVVLSLISSPFLVIPMIKRFGHIPWMVTPKSVTQDAFRFLSKSTINDKARKTTKKLIDLGSGDGRIVIEAAKWGYDAVGYELNPFLYALSHYYAYREGVYSKVQFRMKNFWDENLSNYDVITVFGVTPAMPKLLAKAEHEVKPGTKLISFRFPIISKSHIWRDGELYIYSFDKK